MGPDYVTTSDILDKIGGTRKTLIRWRQRGLIPSPEIRTHPSGRGNVSHWPVWVLDRCLRIKQLLKFGLSLDAIAKSLGSDWENEARMFNKQRYVFAREHQAIVREAAIQNLLEGLEPIVSAWNKSFRTRLHLSPADKAAREAISKAIEQVLNGLNPVIVIAEGAVFATPDFVVSQWLRSHRNVKDLVLVIPVFEPLSKYLAATVTVPAEPTVWPVAKITRSDGGSQTTQEIATLDNWEFVVKPRPKRGKK